MIGCVATYVEAPERWSPEMSKSPRGGAVQSDTGRHPALQTTKSMKSSMYPAGIQSPTRSPCLTTASLSTPLPIVLASLSLCRSAHSSLQVARPASTYLNLRSRTPVARWYVVASSVPSAHALPFLQCFARQVRNATAVPLSIIANLSFARITRQTLRSTGEPNSQYDCLLEMSSSHPPRPRTSLEKFQENINKVRMDQATWWATRPGAYKQPGPMRDPHTRIPHAALPLSIHRHSAGSPYAVPFEGRRKALSRGDQEGPLPPPRTDSESLRGSEAQDRSHLPTPHGAPRAVRCWQ